MASDSAKMVASLERWKRKLLDLSRRNRALNFTATRSSTLYTVGEQPEQVFEYLFVADRPMHFKAMLPEPVKRPVAESGDEIFGSDEDEATLPEMPSEPAVGSDTTLDMRTWPTALDRSLRRLETQSQTLLEEQGVNPLSLAFGMLAYRDPAEPDRERLAPLVLLPVQLERSGARSGYRLAATGDDPALNPALQEYLAQTFRLVLPPMPETGEPFSLRAYLGTLAESVAERANWRVTDDVVLSLFSFHKLAMWQDLEKSAGRFATHPLLRQLVERSGGHPLGLPEDVSEESFRLDEAFAPETTAQVVDADGSQLRAIAAVSKGHSLVLEGPPGTGKSQTITNLIGQALADGKTVLFVAEKMAALNVVQRRLQAAGLGEFCLELHSTKSHKRAVLGSIQAALDASTARLTEDTTAAARLPEARAALTNYVGSVHETLEPLGLTFYQAVGALGEVREAKLVAYDGPPITNVQARTTSERLRVLAQTVEQTGDPERHPWRGTTETFYSDTALARLEALLERLAEGLRHLHAEAPEVQAMMGLPFLSTLQDAEGVRALVDVMEASPGAPLSVLRSDGWNEPPALASDLIARGRALSREHAALARLLQPEAFSALHAEDADYVEAREASPLRFINGLIGRFKEVRGRWTRYRQDGFAPETLTEQAPVMRRVDTWRSANADFEGLAAHGPGLFGELWHGLESDWKALDAYSRWVVAFREQCVRLGLQEQAAVLASRPQPDLTRARALADTAAEMRQALDHLSDAVKWAPGARLGAASSISDALARVEAMRVRVPEQARAWALYESERAYVAASPAAFLLRPALRGEVPFGELPAVFLRSLYQHVLDEAVGAKFELRHFQPLAHEHQAGEFRELDRQVLLNNRTTLVRRMRQRTQATLRDRDLAGELVFLRREINKQRAHAPVRRILKMAGRAVRAIKPCFLMSPLSVAQMLDPSDPPFDLVLFDEASQMTAEDAVGAIVRGQQLVVVGDPKQLPPTNFFSMVAGQIVAEKGPDGEPLVEDSESILEECLGAGFPTTSLKWHYRSREEALIAFSNTAFYGSSLLTFPSVHALSRTYGLSFEPVEDGLYEGKGLNRAEARRVADAVVRFAKEHPDKTLGVGTFNLRQQIAIQDELERRRREDPSLEPFFSATNPEPFFVKNLENIQGDERDVIFLSVTYGRNADGVLRYNFGPINGENGPRRLNVIASRAREGMRVFSSMRGDEIDLARASSEGARFLRQFLLFAERGTLEDVRVLAGAEADSPFEEDVFRALTAHGLRVHKQVGVGPYRIDLAVLSDEVEGRYVCGIECDGAAYHSSQTARDRDRLRQEVLENRGWTIHRVWSTDWFKDRPGALDRLLKLVHQSLENAKTPPSLQAEMAVADERPREDEAVVAREETPATSSESTLRPDADLFDALPPVAEPYQTASVRLRPSYAEFHDRPYADFEEALKAIVAIEAPLHIDDLCTRLMTAAGVGRAGARIRRQVEWLVDVAKEQDVLRRRGDFVWGRDGGCRLRMRAGTGISGARIAPEEYALAIRRILEHRGSLDRPHLRAEVRALFGFGRTGAHLEAAIDDAVDRAMKAGWLVQGSVGLMLS